MSGGVDSSLAAYLLKEAGYQVVGVTMAVYSGAGGRELKGAHACYGPSEEEDLRHAREVAQQLGIEHHVLDLKAEFGQEVLGYVAEEYMQGRTPNPCTRCNPVLKFGLLPERARQAGIAFNRFATGHYARIDYDEGRSRYVLKNGVDEKKDQSYFLYGLRAGMLAEIVLPLGGLTKKEVRRKAEAAGLAVSSRTESQDFVEGGDFTWLFDPGRVSRGPIVDQSGNRLGTHEGIAHYTIGQRRGLGIAHHQPLYVLRIDPANNTLVVGPKNKLFSDTLVVGQLNLLAMDELHRKIRIQAKIRAAHKADDAELIPTGVDRCKLVFDYPQLSITPGQSVVFYDRDVVLGGGIIEGAG
jgi:tRNA-specific 2-thiouridylase